MKDLATKYGVSHGTLLSWRKAFGLAKKFEDVHIEIGQRFGTWTVLSAAPKGEYRVKKWIVQCVCGRTVVKSTGHLLAASKARSKCYMCAKWTGAGEVSGRYWKSVVAHSSDRGMPVTVTVEDAWSAFIKQGGKCAITGLALTFKPNQTASLDRIDNTRGYDIDNIQWVHKRVNVCRNRWPVDDFIKLCFLAAAHFASSHTEAEVAALLRSDITFEDW